MNVFDQFYNAFWTHPTFWSCMLLAISVVFTPRIKVYNKPK